MIGGMPPRSPNTNLHAIFHKPFSETGPAQKSISRRFQSCTLFAHNQFIKVADPFTLSRFSEHIVPITNQPFTVVPALHSVLFYKNTACTVD